MTSYAPTTILLPVDTMTRVTALAIIYRAGITGLHEDWLVNDAVLPLGEVPTAQLEPLAVALRATSSNGMVTSANGRAGLHIAADAVMREHAIRTAAREVCAESTLTYDTPRGHTYRDEGVILTFGTDQQQLTPDEARDLADQLLIAADATDNGVEGYHLTTDADTFRGQFG